MHPKRLSFPKIATFNQDARQDRIDYQYSSSSNTGPLCLLHKIYTVLCPLEVNAIFFTILDSDVRASVLRASGRALGWAQLCAAGYRCAPLGTFVLILQLVARNY